MMDASLCDRTVTRYRMVEGQMHRRVLERCYLESTTRVDYDEDGRTVQRPFLLILPGHEMIHVDDLIYDGIGPDVADIPANDPKLMQVQYVTEFPGHTEAGRKSAAFGY